MHCELEQQLEVYRFAVFAQLGLYVPRPEMKALCQLALEQGGRITAAVVSKLLPDPSAAAVSNLIGWCNRIGLCDSSGVLTDHGQRAARDGRAPLLEEGVYEMWGVQHPVVGGRVLHFERVRLDVEEEGVADELPMVVDRGKVWKSAVDETDFEVRDLPSGERFPMGYMDRNHRSVCKFKWEIDFTAETNSWWLEGSLHSGRGDRDLPFKTSPVSRDVDVTALADQWMTELNGETQRWNRQGRRLDMPFGATDNLVRRTFRTDVVIKVARVGSNEAYQNVKVRDVPVGPLSPEDAAQWLKWRLTESLDKPGYRSPEMLRDEYVSVTVGTPLQGMTECPDAREVLQDLQKHRRLFWRVAAGHDLAQPEAVLRPSADVKAPVQVPEIVRLDRLKNWSMKDWVTQMLGPVTPRRVLLCDRYVSGDANLRTFGVLVETLRRLHPNAKCTVVTLRDAKDPTQAKRIAEWTRAQLVWFDEAFGDRKQDAPHDRFFLVDGVTFDGVTYRWGWQMSNSPLAARPLSDGRVTADSPLEWRDLVCSRVTLQDLRFYRFLFDWLTEDKS